MPERVIHISEEIWNWIFKILLPTIVALIISISIQLKNKTANVTGILLSIITGLGCSYLSGDWVIHHVSSDYTSLLIGTIAIGGEKVGYWLIYKFKFDVIGNAMIKWVINKFK